MTEIYLIRHAQAEGNLYHMLQGHWDGDVTPLGLRQIDALAEFFKDIRLDALYSSDLLRTRRTAGAITKYHRLEMHTDARLREINVGPWETEFFGNVMKTQPETVRIFMTDPESFYLDGAETYRQVGQRALEALKDIVAAYPDGRVAIVTHGITLRCLISAVTGISLNDTETLPIFKNTGIAHLYYENGAYTADYLNYAPHLTQELISRPGGLILRDEPLDPYAERQYYTACYRDAWLFAHGDLSAYDEQSYYASACRHYDADSTALFHAYAFDEDAGLLDLDTRRGAHAGYGWISLLYLKPEYRGKGCGIQLLARAYKKYQSLGRSSIRLQTAEDNTAAMHFYERCGFKKLSYENGPVSRLWLMEKKL